MAYDAVPDKPTSPPPFYGSGDDFEPLDPSHLSNRRVRTFLRLSTANLVLLICQIVLLIVHIAPSFIPVRTRSIQSTYGFDTKYMTLDHAYDWLWEEQAVKSAGAIAVTKDANNVVTEYGTISMFHQLHCVASLRTALQRAYEGGNVAFNEREDPHWPHCLHYLHQSILCNANGQVEKQETWNFTLPFISGAEDVRQCGNSKGLYEFFETHSA